MEENRIYDLVRLINNHDDIDTELIAAAKNINGILRHKYVSRLYSAAEESRKEAEAHPSKEAALLRALKMYACGEKAETLERIIGAINMADTIGNINRNLKGGYGEIYAIDSDGERGNKRAEEVTKALMIMALLGRL